MKFHLILFVSPSVFDDQEKTIKSIILELGFSEIFIDNNIKYPCVRNMYSGYLEKEINESSLFSQEDAVKELILSLSEIFKEKLKSNYIPMIQFFIVDITKANYILDYYHDGFY